MSLDLNDLLRDWPHEPGVIKVRKILGSDGKEKLQLRIDLGLIQMETSGRPDGQEPHDCESLLEYHQRRATRATKKGESFALTPDEVGELQQEGIQYYHRYIALFQLQDYIGVIRDTQRNLEMFAFVSKHAPNEELGWSVEQFTPYVRMMNTRAKASIAIEREDFQEAVALIEKGIDRIREFCDRTENPELAAQSAEIAFLNEWLEEVKARQPLTKLQRMHREMDRAIAMEQYERAAEIRDQIKAHAKRNENG
ncbi:MAG: UvrB/UvrC motif-containing protein [Verrucomicrobiota bacterium]|nr:UvrB/UvrC motif-containing protein [Verrucomicrobiota bacterium]